MQGGWIWRERFPATEDSGTDSAEDRACILAQGMKYAPVNVFCCHDSLKSIDLGIQLVGFFKKNAQRRFWTKTIQNRSKTVRKWPKWPLIHIFVCSIIPKTSRKVCHKVRSQQIDYWPQKYALVCTTTTPTAITTMSRIIHGWPLMQIIQFIGEFEETCVVPSTKRDLLWMINSFGTSHRSDVFNSDPATQSKTCSIPMNGAWWPFVSNSLKTPS